ncbi:hypothetical protein [Porphyromonas macacae]|uniref:Uncharacterized protein n=1 Tax=Porphyromonas macacae TaxID=28115 RepID=A0A379DKZ8_9PORP|nr:hypothetical protein [Porphyromonas macacae]SUB78624.1 Uncharacterised protein [Porphyromonas macacae]
MKYSYDLLKKRYEDALFQAKVSEQNLQRRLQYVNENKSDIIKQKAYRTVAPHNSFADRTVRRIKILKGHAGQIFSSFIPGIFKPSKQKNENILGHIRNTGGRITGHASDERPRPLEMTVADEKLGQNIYEIIKPVLWIGTMSFVKRNFLNRIFRRKKK